jgi:GNAT superfamily N-acetyltransferase
MDYQVYTLGQKPHLEDQIDEISAQAWPEFLRHGDTTYWNHLFDDLAPYQLLFCAADDRVIAVAHTAPLVWDGTVDDLPPKIQDVLARALHDLEAASSLTTLCALAAMIRSEHRGQGLSIRLVDAMRGLAARHGLSALIAPVRPAMKAGYPLIPFPEYVQWTRDDGAPFDPWIRVHWRLGARTLGVAPSTMTVTGTVAKWESWTGLVFPGSGEYVVPGALQPVVIDRLRDEGRYEDPNLWMIHDTG